MTPDVSDNCPTEPNVDQSDADADGVGDRCDRCLNTLPGVPVDGFGCARLVSADLDHDGDVDLSDFGLFQICLSGPGVPQLSPSCADALLDGDVDVDQEDFGILQSCISGPNIVADPACLH